MKQCPTEQAMEEVAERNAVRANAELAALRDVAQWASESLRLADQSAKYGTDKEQRAMFDSAANSLRAALARYDALRGTR